MFDHVKFGVSDYAASKAFFLEALEPLGVAVIAEGSPTYGVELSPKGKASLCLYQTDEKPAHLHLAFTAGNRQQVDAFYRAALAAGGKGTAESPLLTAGARKEFSPVAISSLQGVRAVAFLHESNVAGRGIERLGHPIQRAVHYRMDTERGRRWLLVHIDANGLVADFDVVDN